MRHTRWRAFMVASEYTRRPSAAHRTRPGTPGTARGGRVDPLPGRASPLPNDGRPVAPGAGARHEPVTCLADAAPETSWHSRYTSGPGGRRPADAARAARLDEPLQTWSSGRPERGRPGW